MQEHILHVPGLAAKEALRAILDHERISYTVAQGVGGQVIVIAKSDYQRVRDIVHQWQTAIHWIHNAV